MYNRGVLAALVPMVAAHGFISSPAARQPGSAYQAACGQQPFFQQSSDINGNVQGILQVVGSDLDEAACNVWLCKGFQFDDNTANVQSFSLGQTIDFEINIAAPHTGVANVSVVKTSSNTIIGSPLIEFENYASNAGVNPGDRAFSVTLPEDLEGECTTAGDCVLQWYWDAADINQTYESCVDFTVSGGAGNPPATPSNPPTTPSGTPSVPSSTPAPSDPAEEPVEEPEEDDECPADDDEEEEEEEEEDDECPADDEEDEEEEDDECPADEDEEEEEDDE
ncbi:hypothetical protein B0I35DRAFT_45962 [Stachybotrys elegans]|uniref:Chitin-binding type-4 domain-containing protein n=1 Tax=Stachybotrys elegans TaxID=80388 RepID=A0A8K0T8X9_9HYPO|nr:hypothetical protein B0I35DRAFT_45962 [Stachybotrys elegans]